jgi:hypothetical protein
MTWDIDSLWLTETPLRHERLIKVPRIYTPIGFNQPDPRFSTLLQTPEIHERDPWSFFHEENGHVRFLEDDLGCFVSSTAGGSSTPLALVDHELPFQLRPRGAWGPDFWRNYTQDTDIHGETSPARNLSRWELPKKTWRSCADVSTLKRRKSLPKNLQGKLWMAIEDDLLATGDAESGFEEQYVNRIGKEDIGIWKQNCDRKKSWKRCSRDDSAKQQV